MGAIGAHIPGEGVRIHPPGAQSAIRPVNPNSGLPEFGATIGELRLRAKMRVVIFYAVPHERGLAELLSVRLIGRKDAKRTISAAISNAKCPRHFRSFARIVRQIWTYVRGLPPLSYVIALVLCGYRRARARWTVKKLSPDVIVLFEDNIGNFTRIMGAAAARLNIPYVVLPTTIPNPREAAHFFRSSKVHAVSGMVARLIAHRWPHDFEGRQTLRLPAADIMAMHLLRVENAKPWILNSGQATAICVESTAMRRIYERLGVDARLLVTIGNLIDDTLFEVSRHREDRQRVLTTELGLDPDRMLLVVAFPPNQFAAPSNLSFEYASFADMVAGWLRALAPLARSVNIVLRAHPRLELFETAGCHIFTGPTEELVPLADVFVASISATIRWALALGIPVINYDCYRYRYDDYSGAAGMVLVEHQRAFASALREICLDPAAHKKLCGRQNSDRSNWGCIDGEFSTRFLRLLTSVSRAPGDPISVVGHLLPRL
jgi:hypothetical protein